MNELSSSDPSSDPSEDFRSALASVMESSDPSEHGRSALASELSSSDPSERVRSAVSAKEVIIQLNKLVDCLYDIISRCTENGRVKIAKWEDMDEITTNLLMDIEGVMEQCDVAKNMNLQKWMKLLEFLEEINPQKRETTIHVEERTDLRRSKLPFKLCHLLGTINLLLLDGIVTTVKLPIVCEIVTCCLGSIAGRFTRGVDAVGVPSLSSYKVSLQDISVHIPLHRFLSAVLQKAFSVYHSESDFFSRTLRCPSSGHLFTFAMELPLRVKVFCAQVKAGMWRKNGDLALLPYEWCRSFRWSEPSLLHDLFLLQCCAAVGPPDQYVNRILECFELSDYLSLNLECSNEYEPTLVQEMLTLIIQIVKERRFCALDTRECLQRDLVYKLSAGDATHDQLVKSLPNYLSMNGELEEVLKSIAVFSEPTVKDEGKYKLQPSYWKELDLYHPSYTTKQLQVAVERYKQFCKKSAWNSQLPKWSEIHPVLNEVAHIGTCSKTIQILRATIYYAVFSDKSHASRAPVAVVTTALHLLSLALDICSVHRESSDRTFYEDGIVPTLGLATEELPHGDQNLLSLLVLLMEKYREDTDISSLISALLKRFSELDPECNAKLQDLAPEVIEKDKMESDSDKRKAKALERQAAIMEELRAQQFRFSENSGSSTQAELDSSEEVNPFICSLCHDSNSARPISYMIRLQRSRLLTFTNRGPPSWEHTETSGKDPTYLEKMMTNVYSRSNLNLLSGIREAIVAGTSRNSEEERALQILETEISSLIQEKMGNSRESFDSPYAHENENAHGKQLESSMLHRTYQTFGPLYCDGVYQSSCGHAVHERCLSDYLSSSTVRVSDEEFLCPVCRGFANFVLPASLAPAPADPTRFTPSSSGAAEALTFQDALLCLRSAADIAGSKEVLQKLTSQHFGQGRKEYWPLVEVLRYSIISTEIMARSRNMDLTPDYSLRALYRELQSSNGAVLALLLRIVESTLTMDAFIVRFRWRAIVLLAESICWGSSLKEIRDEGCSFWRWCSDPILGHDAFSSLVYIVVCLPSCPGDTFLSMVQLLYAVAVTQAIIAFYRKHKDAELPQEGGLIRDVCSFICQHGDIWPIFSCFEDTSSGNVKDAIQTMTSPYLRRCALLWSLIRPAEHDEMGRLEQVLNIPPLEDIFSDMPLSRVVQKWLRHFYTSCGLSLVLYITPTAPFRLMILPNLYQDLLKRYTGHNCPDCGDDKVDRALCLLCGRLCSRSWRNTCCRESGSGTHAEACGAGFGVFLLLRSTRIILHRNAHRKAWCHSPYLDEFGQEHVEEDSQVPLYLNEKRYAALTHMVASHGFFPPHSNPF